MHILSIAMFGVNLKCKLFRRHFPILQNHLGALFLDARIWRMVKVVPSLDIEMEFLKALMAISSSFCYFSDS